MNNSSQQSLLTFNSFAVESNSPNVYFPETRDDLELLASELKVPFYILGEGSNTLFVHDEAPMIICPNFKGVEITETESEYLLKVAAGENWHQLVLTCVEKNIAGLENLALIPGSVGAAPVQNIGAYGVDFSMYCREVTWFDFDTGCFQILSNSECQFNYRNSIFKSTLKNKGLITEVVLALPKKWQPVLNYNGLDQLPMQSTCFEVMNKVIEIRQLKLPDPNILPNAGSFFKNPVVTNSQFEQLTNKFGTMPHYLQADKSVKLAAGWLIEQAGLKGYRIGDVGVHDKQALVLVNYGSKSGIDIVKLAGYIQHVVKSKFDINLEPEVRLVGENGETSLSEILFEEQI